MDKNQVYCIDSKHLLPQFDKGSVNLIIADPPYGIGYHSNYYKGRNPHAPITSDWNFQIGPFLRECARVLIDGGALYLFCRWDVSPLWMSNIVLPLKFKTAIAWVKDNWSAGDLEGCFGNQYEQILFITKGRHKLRGKRWSNVWQFPRVTAKQLLHPAQKPLGLVERAILASSDEGDLVLDPFAGAGTTGLAAKNYKRDFIMGDIDGTMAKIASSRVGIAAEPNVVDKPISVAEWESPDPVEWGIHPEDFATVMEFIQRNQQSAQLSLFEKVIE